MSEFSDRLRELRERSRMSVQDLAEAAGLTRQYLWHLERGTKAPSWETVVALAEAMGASTEEFRGDA